MGEQKFYTQVPCFTRIDGIIQDLPSNGWTMEMNHPLWPVVRETSRRILRNEEILISGPIQFQQLVINLGSKISDSIPERLKFPVFVESEKQTIDIFKNSIKPCNLIATIGTVEVKLEACWVYCEVSFGLQSVIESCYQLLEAGYPGCLGCEGTSQDERWDEKNFRKSWQME